jgi:hypothetical protein|nr:MAG TPA: Protein of unknown function (DUF3826) [Caudoviricetes sp.]
MTKEQKENICKWLDERWQIALTTDARMGNTKDEFLPNNPDYIYYKGACDGIFAMGYDWKRTNGKHNIYKL